MTKDLELQGLDELTAEAVMRWLKPTSDETSEVITSRRSDLRHWTLHRHSGKPIENFSSYYWRPPPLSTSAHYSKLLRDKLAERWDWTMLSWLSGTRFTFGIYPKGDRLEVFTHVGYGETEELCVVLCALESVGCGVEKGRM